MLYVFNNYIIFIDPPSAALVEHVRNIYQQRVPDVRFLIPVLNGLGKKEIIAVLPKLIKLNPDVVKKVFTRLLGTQVRFIPPYVFMEIATVFSFGSVG